MSLLGFFFVCVCVCVCVFVCVCVCVLLKQSMSLHFNILQHMKEMSELSGRVCNNSNDLTLSHKMNEMNRLESTLSNQTQVCGSYNNTQVHGAYTNTHVHIS